MSSLLSMFKKSPAGRFKKYITKCGYSTDEIISDGKIHYFQNEKTSNSACFYVLLKDEQDHHCGVFGNWKKNKVKMWDGGHRTSSQDGGHGCGHDLQVRMDEVKQYIKVKYTQWKPKNIWGQAKPWGSHDSHPFLQNKKISGCGNIRVLDDELIIPIKDVNNKIVAVQKIDKNGVKKNINKRGVQGNYFYIQGKSDVLYVCCDYETAVTVKMAVKGSVACVLWAENMRPVVLNLREKHPELKIILVAYNDRTPKGKKYLQAVMEIGKKVSARTIFPSFSSHGKGLETFNHLLIQQGMQVVQEQLLSKEYLKTENTQKVVTECQTHETPGGARTGTRADTDVHEVEENISIIVSDSIRREDTSDHVSAGSSTELQNVVPREKTVSTDMKITKDIFPLPPEPEPESESITIETARNQTGTPTSLAEDVDPLYDLNLKIWPTPRQEIFAGFAGKFVQFATENSEADPVAVLVTLLIRFGVEIGRGIYINHAGEQCGRLNAVLVGATAMGRKGTSAKPVESLFIFCDSAKWSRATTSSGPLSSGEGMIEAVKDPESKWQHTEEHPEGEWVVKDPGAKDKRLFVLESEFATALVSMKRAGNTLSTVLRCAYDGVPLAPLTKKNKISSTGHHIGIVGHITQEELVKKIGKVELQNGFANRFLWLCVRKSQCCPFPGILHPEKMKQFRDDLLAILQWSKKNEGAMVFSEDARQVWEKHYRDLSIERSGLSDMILSRALTNTLRLALLYAVLDKSKKIKKHHLESSLALSKYVEQSVEYIFGDAIQDTPGNKIIDSLTKATGGLTGKELHAIFSNHLPRLEMESTLNRLIAHNKITVLDEKTKGRPRKRFFLTQDVCLL